MNAFIAECVARDYFSSTFSHLHTSHKRSPVVAEWGVTSIPKHACREHRENNNNVTLGPTSQAKPKTPGWAAAYALRAEPAPLTPYRISMNA